MNFKKSLVYLSLFGAGIFQSCTEEKKEEIQDQPVIVITNNDIEQARELIFSAPVQDTTWLIDSSNTGFGQRQDFNADSAAVKHLFAAEENTDWYRFVAPADTSLAITVEPNDPTAEYDLVVFKSTGDSTGADLRKGLVPAVRSNFARRSLPEDTITGLGCNWRFQEHVPVDSTQQFAEAFWMQKGETYYVVLNTPNGKGQGYKLRIHSCAPGEGKGGVGATSKGKAPEITAFFPKSGGKGRNVTIIGKHFTGATVVNFGGMAAQQFKVLSSSKILATVGEGATGPVMVSTPLGMAEMDSFTWTEQKAQQAATRFKPKKKQPADDGDYYIVKPKDTMFSIAFIFGMTVDEILKLNKLSNTNVFVGQKLKVIRRQLSQKKIEQKVAVAPKVTPSKPEKGSTTDPEKTVTQKSTPDGDEIKPMENKTANFTPTPNMPKEKAGLNTSTEDKNSLAPADKSFFIYCNVTSGVTKSPVAGTLQVVDLKKKNLVYNVQANKTQKVPLFNDGGQQKLIIADIFGYRKQDFDLNLDNIINDSTAQQVTIVDDTIVINFEMQRLKKNDVAVAYNIFYYDDASVMLPKSTYELDQLLELMNENKNIKIRIHGHTNTSKLGNILYLEKGDPNFFRLTNRNKTTFGPAKTLSKKRAETIKYYLESKRITDDRIETEGHGGSQMLYPPTHPLAYKNKRVEIEILAD